MNSETAAHLNRLRKRREPVSLNTGGVPCGPPFLLGEIKSQVEQILNAAKPAVLAAMIREAAQKGEEAPTGFVDSGPHWWNKDGHPWETTARLYKECAAELTALFDRDNAARLAEYEAYRAACAQGVAVPPSD